MKQHTNARKGYVRPIQPCLEGVHKGRKMGVSPIIATLLLIVIAVAGSIVAYAFVTGFIGGVQPQPLNTGMSVDSVSSSQSNVILYIRNTGDAPLTVATCYVQGASSLVMIPITPAISLSPGGVSTITIANNFSDGQYQFKVVSTSGAQCITNSYISGGNGSGGGDTTPPTCSSVGTNTTIAGDLCLFSSSWSDNVGLSGFIFSTNVTGSWVNSSWIAFTGNVASAVMALPPSAGIVVGFAFYANDTSNNWSTSGITYVTTTAATSPLSVNCTALNPSSSRVNNGSAVSLSYYLLWSSNSSAVASGILQINGINYTISGGWCNFTVSSSFVTKITYAETLVDSGGCTLYNQLPSNPSVIWDRLNVTYASNGTRLQVGQTAQITINATYEYDNSPASITVNTLRSGTHYANTSNFYDNEPGAKVYTYSLENFTDMNGITAYDSNPLTVRWSIAPPGVVAYFPITLTNNQATATTANFQQQLFINWSLCNPYVNSSLSNIVFFDNNGNQLYAWDENGTTNASNSLTTVWVNLGSNTVAANGNITINIGFYPLNYENRSPTSYWGMFPNATSVYAKCDNGNKVFTFYDNFAGTSLSSQWATQASSGGSLSVNNGITFSVAGASDYIWIHTPSLAYPLTEEANITSQLGSPYITIAASLTTTLNGIYGEPYNGYDYDWYGGYVEIDYNTISNSLSNSYATVPFSPGVWSFSWYATGRQAGTNGVNPLTDTNSGTPIGNYYLYLGIGNYAASQFTAQWYRARITPPNNIMPSVSFGGFIVP